MTRLYAPMARWFSEAGAASSSNEVDGIPASLHGKQRFRRPNDCCYAKTDTEPSTRRCLVILLFFVIILPLAVALIFPGAPPVKISDE